MKVHGLDGKLYQWNLTGHKPMKNDSRPRSSFHKRARILLQNLFPFEQILEELSLPGAGRLYADFFIPSKKLLVEVQGSQHSEFNPHFHGTERGFLEAKKRDSKKQQWAEINNFTLIEFPYDESDGEWKARIDNRGTAEGS